MIPYIAIVFANRNDGYTSDQNERIRHFIDFYAYYDKKYKDLFEFIICDWNPPPGRKQLKDQYAWNKLTRVTHLVVPGRIHSELCPDNSRPILDYTARNVCIRRASAPFILVVNQDIFLSSSIFEFLSKRSLSENCFYRADRCDFNFNYEEGFDKWDHFDEYAKKDVLTKHIRALSHLEEMSIPITDKTFERVYTRRKFFEYKINNIIYSDIYHYKKFFRCIESKLKKLVSCTSDCSYTDFFLHTNASGDFLLAPKKAFYEVHGFIETYRFYMHLDAYMCMQLFAAGYKQAILSVPHTVFHSHHSRSAREGRAELMTYHEHKKIFDAICLSQHPYKINQDSWGLKNMSLEVEA